MKPSDRIRPHDNFDLGWYSSPNGFLSHYFRSNNYSHLAITHCGLPYRKDELKPADETNVCQYCAMIETTRNQMDGRNVDKI